MKGVIIILELRPFLAIVGSMLVGQLVAHGVIDGTNATVVQQNLDTLAGAIITVLSAAAALHHYVMKHPVKSVEQPVTQVTQETVQSTTQVSTPVVQDDVVAPPVEVAAVG